MTIEDNQSHKRLLSARAVILIGILLCTFSCDLLAAGIVADGNTKTGVSTTASGHQTVSIAPAIGGVSHNTYFSFDVTSAGADLDNTGINAHTILNEVTSTRASLIKGAVAVLGPRANVVLANPNGIAIDGGSFVNVGHLALSTGQVSFGDVTRSRGGMQRNLTLVTNGGTIAIGPGGLSGSLINLDLVAKHLAVSGPVTNDFASSTGGVRATIGSSTTTWNTGFLPSDTLHDWLVSTANPGNTGTGFQVDITAAGGLTGGHVQLVITDRGAGVRNLGSVYAGAGDVVISTEGDIGAANGSIVAEHDIAITTPGTLYLRGAEAIAANGIKVEAGAIALSDDAKKPSRLATVGGPISLTATGDISNSGSVIQAGGFAVEGALSGGDVTLTSGGRIMNRSTPANLGIVFAPSGDVSFRAQGDIINENARIVANQGVTLAAEGDLVNISDHTGGTNDAQPVTYSRQGGSFLFLKHTTNGFDVDYGAVTDPSQPAYIAATGGPVTISGRNVTNSGGVVQSNGGDITIQAVGAFTNAAIFSGQAHYSRDCWIFCNASAWSTVQAYGGTVESIKDGTGNGGKLAITAGGVARNIGGSVFAEDDIDVTAPVIYAGSVRGYSAISQQRGFKAFLGSTWAQIMAFDIGGGFASSGAVRLTGDAILDGGSISAVKGIYGNGSITTVRSPSHAPVQIGQHLGATTWIGF